ncbi:hypothetical protein DFH07DRAFT_784916 [Mycena maculata]|uniref:Uncharacterized protein n=1 Tax=Mycena maculata TaxID=230809 RepID=A0AAD7HE17_9AGAR|nr:hypothetical protein DFH07DRAFT_784916 [Mycena maculata]
MSWCLGTHRCGEGRWVRKWTALDQEHNINPSKQAYALKTAKTVDQTILGHSFDPLDSPATNAYTHVIGELIMRRWLVEWTPNAAVQRVKAMSDVMHETAVRILAEARAGVEKADANKAARAKDIITLLHHIAVGREVERRNPVRGEGTAALREARGRRRGASVN